MRTSAPRRNRGQILVIVALSSVVLIAFAALGIDSGITYAVKAKLNAAVDATAIAAARATISGTDDTARAAAAVAAGNKFFDLNFPVGGFLGATTGTPRVTIKPVHQNDGKWSITVSADATRPTFLMGILGMNSMTVHAQAGSVRRDVDMILVIDTSGSLGSDFPQVKADSINFLKRFAAGAGGDRVGLVMFASGAHLYIPINKDAARGFDLAGMTASINSIPAASGTTSSAEALRVAHDEIDAIDPALRSSLRVIVFFSDGAPNDVPAKYTRKDAGGNLVGYVTGDLHSDTAGSAAGRATVLYDNTQRNVGAGTYSDIPSLPDFGLSTTAWGQAPAAIPLASYDGARSFIAWPANSRCNVNMAARNMAENTANTIRGEGIYVYTLGLGVYLNQLEPNFTPSTCGYLAGDGKTEFGARILQRIANVPDPGDPKVKQNGTQPIGMYVYAPDTSALDGAFTAIASEILRLSQ